MKRFVLAVFVVSMALSTVASAEAIIFNLQFGAPTSSFGGSGAWTFNVPVTSVQNQSGSQIASCVSCTLHFTTGTLSSGGLGGDTFGVGGTYNIPGTSITTTPPVGPGTYATNGNGPTTLTNNGSGIGLFTGSIAEPGSSGFQTVLAAFGLPTGLPYKGSITMVISGLTFGAGGSFSSGSVLGGNLALSPVPESTSAILFGIGLVLLGIFRWRYRSAHNQ